MSVYFIRAGESGAVKIGLTQNIKERLIDLQCGNHERLILLREIPGGPLVERWLHRRFAEYKIHLEWFRFTDEMLTVEPPENPNISEPKIAKTRRVKMGIPKIEREPIPRPLPPPENSKASMKSQRERRSRYRDSEAAERYRTYKREQMRRLRAARAQ